MKDAKDTTNKLADDFDKLTDSYTRMFRMCFDALNPTTPIRRRNEVRDALAAYLDDKPGKEPTNK